MTKQDQELHDWAWVLSLPPETRVTWRDFPDNVFGEFSVGGDFYCCDSELYEVEVWFTRSMFTDRGWKIYTGEVRGER
jgi:hypothetical protein